MASKPHSEIVETIRGMFGDCDCRVVGREEAEAYLRDLRAAEAALESLVEQLEVARRQRDELDSDWKAMYQTKEDIREQLESLRAAALEAENSMFAMDVDGNTHLYLPIENWLPMLEALELDSNHYSVSNQHSVHRASAELLSVMERVGDAMIYMPVMRVGEGGNLRAPDMVAAIPVPLWEELVGAFDAFDTGWQGDE